MSRKPQLGDVTVCTADSLHPDLAARALEKCLGQCDFADAILFSDTQIEGSFRNVEIPRLTSAYAYSRFCLHELAELVSTPFVLVIQWDGYVTDASAWQARFQKHDYVGAVTRFPYVGRIVGNGGFSLRSRKLLQATAKLPPLREYPEDYCICHVHRETLERQYGIRFAPEKLATRFSYQDRDPHAPTFGFHGAYNLWRHMDDGEIASLASTLTGNELIARRVLKLILNCQANDRPTAAATLYAELRRHRSFEAIKLQTKRKFRVPRQYDDAIAGLTAMERMHSGA